MEPPDRIRVGRLVPGLLLHHELDAASHPAKRFDQQPGRADGDVAVLPAVEDEERHVLEPREAAFVHERRDTRIAPSRRQGGIAGEDGQRAIAFRVLEVGAIHAVAAHREAGEHDARGVDGVVAHHGSDGLLDVLLGPVAREMIRAPAAARRHLDALTVAEVVGAGQRRLVRRATVEEHD